MLTVKGSKAKNPQPWVNPRASKTCTWSPTTSRIAEYTDHGPVFYEDGTRPAYVNSIAVDKKGNVYTQARITRNGKVQTELICIPKPE